MDEEEEDDVELQIEIMKAQLDWDWRLTCIVTLIGILVASATALRDHPLLWSVLSFLLGIILVVGCIWSDWPDRKAKELREKYLKEREQGKEKD